MSRQSIGRFTVEVCSWDDGGGSIEAQATVWTNLRGAPWSLGAHVASTKEEAECLATLAAIREHKARERQ